MGPRHHRTNAQHPQRAAACPPPRSACGSDSQHPPAPARACSLHAPRRPAMPQRHGCHQGMGAYQSPSLAAPHFQPDPAGLGALAARSEAGGAVGSARAGPIRRCRRPATPGGRAQTRPPFRAIGMRRGGITFRIVFSGPKAKADGLPGPEKGISKSLHVLSAQRTSGMLMPDTQLQRHPGHPRCYRPA